MGVETAILAGLSAGASYKADRDKRKAQKQAQKQQQKLLDQQLDDKTKDLEDESKARAAALRARYGATGLRTTSRSALGLLHALDKRTNEDIQSLRTTRDLRSPNLLTNDSSNVAGLLRSLQSFSR